MNIRRQDGLTTVEFAIIGAAMFVVLFGVIEISRAMFVLNVLGESTRRAARIAAVCPVTDGAPREVALFNAPGQGTVSRFIRGLTPGHLAIEYLDANGNVIANPTLNFNQILFVRARVVGFQHQMLIPFASYLFNTPSFSTTLRRESLGVPRDGVIQPC
jgi:Flp pilus assembly protein TadG